MQTLKDVMTTNCITASPEDSIIHVSQMMREHNIGIIPLVDHLGKLLGVVTDRDMAIRGYAENKNGSEAVDTIVSHKTVTADPNTTVEDAAQMMAKNQIRRLPIVEDGQLAGIVAIGDLAVRQQTDEVAGEALSEISEPASQEQK